MARRLRLTLHLRSRGEETRARRRGHKARRWVVERTHSWLNRFHRLLVRDHHLRRADAKAWALYLVLVTVATNTA